MHVDVLALLQASASGAWTFSGDVLTGRAPAQTDLFTSPQTAQPLANAPTLLFPAPEDDFLLQAEVRVEFASTFDAGVLLLWQDPDHWAKLCFELSPQRDPMVVSVVNRGISDDANGPVITSDRTHLRIGRRGPACVFHYSADGACWHFIRLFRLAGRPLLAGFLVQSPTGGGCRAEFRGIRLSQETIADVRSGA